MWRRYRLKVILLVFIFLTLGGRAVQAAADFTRSLNLTYAVLADGSTLVKYEVRLKNNFSTVYAKQYALTINGVALGQVEARDSDGQPLPFTVNEYENQTAITVQLDARSKVLGKDKERLFTITYLSPDAAEIYGQILEVAVPKLAEPESYAQYNVTITVPESFGSPAIVEPARYTFDAANGLGVLRFTGVGQASGIAALFGDEQSYDAQLTYHVANHSQNVGVVQVALPPDTAYQRVIYRQINPQPERITADVDGNWIAEFRIDGQAEQAIQADLQIAVLAHPQPPLPVQNPQKPNHSLFGGTVVDYLQPTTYWTVNQPAIRQLAQQYQTPQAIYQYVVDALQYNYRRFQQPDALQRLGSTAALEDPANAVCLEFTDLFVAIARAAGIPARRATGYALAKNNRLRPLSLVADVLHAWPEYYDVQRNYWVAIDPTWADTTGGIDYFTKLDLRHLTFAVQGQNDDRPYPAGLYKIPGKEQKDVQVELATAKLVPSTPLTIEHKPGILPRWGLPTREIFLITNQTGTARYNIDIAVGVEGQVKLLTDAKIRLPVLLPYETYTLGVELSGDSWLQPQSAQLNLFIGDQEQHYDIIARRSFSQPFYRWFLLGGIVVIVAASAGGLLVFSHRRHRAVRRQS